MAVTLFYTGGKPHTLADRLKDMKHMLLQQQEYDLSTDEGKENTWHMVNAMLLSAGTVFLGYLISDKIDEPFRQKRIDDMKMRAFRDGQVAAYRNVMTTFKVASDKLEVTKF